MINLKDIYYQMNNYLRINNYHLETNKKDIIDRCLRKYLKNKILEINPYLKINDNLEVNDLFNILVSFIPIEEDFMTIRYLIHYLISIISSLQEFEMIWYASEEDIDSILIEVLDDGKWNSLKTKINCDYRLVFNNLYQAFKSYFLEEELKRILK